MVQTVRIAGLKEVKQALHELPGATAKNIMKRVLLKRAQPVAAAAQANAPVYEGFLKTAIHVSTKLTRRQRGRHRKTDPDDVEVFVGPGTDPAAHLQEFGSKRHAAQPFMRPAWERTRFGVIDGVTEDMRNEIRKAVERRLRKAQRAADRAKR